MRLISLILASALLATAAKAAERTPPQCFFQDRYQGFKAADDRTFYILVDLHDYYRIGTAGACPLLTRPDARLLTQSHGGSQTICGPRDWELKVAELGEERFAQGCVVQSQTPLTPAQAAALPPNLKP